MQSLVDLLEHLLTDVGRRSAAPVHRDVKTLRERVAHEGDSFITITLPAFCKDFERSLDEGRVAPGRFLSFRKRASGIPAFLSGFLRHVFDCDGSLLPEPRVDCIRAIRQICLFGKKVRRTCTSARLLDATKRFKQCDDEVADSVPETQVARYFKLVADSVMSHYDLGSKAVRSMRPRHGPGATRERILGNQKWRFLRWHDRLEVAGFTYDDFGRASNIATLEDMAAHPDLVFPLDEEPVRVVFVPKTLKTPRVIAIEPVCMQYAQQAMLRLLVPQIETCGPTAGHVNFTDQSVNQALAKTSSENGQMATLDMSEASDRVSLAHVESLLARVPVFRDLVLAARSTRAELPDGEILHLRKFASMGSALCFPMEALTFYCVILASRLSRAGIFPTRTSIRTYGMDVYIYGDDIIVPAGEAAAICDDLESMGLKVNRHKSFWTGKFRESCGSDAYDGQSVTPIYLTRDVPQDRRDVAGLLSTIATCNQLFEAGYYVTAAALRNAVESVLGRKLPEVPVDSPALGWHFYSEEMPFRRWNRDLQRAETQALVVKPRRVSDPLDGDPALAKCLGRVGTGLLDLTDPTAPIDDSDPTHLATSSRRYGLALKRSWVPAPRVLSGKTGQEKRKQ